VLGASPLPVEVVPFSALYVTREIEALGAGVSVRERDGAPLVSDNGNTILDCRFGSIPDPQELDAVLRGIHGVVTTGIFIGLTSRIVLASDDGTVRELSRAR
jgi:ribose 5-phosphate isomerase A